METIAKTKNPLHAYSAFGDSICEDEIFIEQYGPFINPDSETEKAQQSKIIEDGQYDEDLEEFFGY